MPVIICKNDKHLVTLYHVYQPDSFANTVIQPARTVKGHDL